MKAFAKIASYASVGACSWWIGSLYEQKKNIWKPPPLPGLPLCGTVSAAELITRSPSSVIPAPPELKISEPPPKPTRIAQIMRFGFPGMDTVRSYDDYVVSYDRRNRVPHWVFEHLTKDSVAKNDSVDRSKCDFKEDPSVHGFFRASNSDYKYSGYDRGHMAAAGNHRICQDHCDQTFFLSNIAPQVGKGFNRDKWNDLEKHVRRLTKEYANVYVCTGPLYLPTKDVDGKLYIKYQVIGNNHVAVPTHFFKVVVGEAHDSCLDMEAYIMPNVAIDDNIPVSSFMVSPDTVERSAGLLFFDRISRNKLRKINGKQEIFL